MSGKLMCRIAQVPLYLILIWECFKIRNIIHKASNVLNFNASTCLCNFVTIVYNTSNQYSLVLKKYFFFFAFVISLIFLNTNALLVYIFLNQTLPNQNQIQWNLCNPTHKFSRHPVTSNKNL
jgi:hypothetical protein